MPGNGKQQIIAVIGLALIIANLVKATTAGNGFVAVIFGKSNANPDAALTQIKHLGLEIAVVLVLVLIAGVSDDVANVSLVFTIGLALLWIMLFWGRLDTSKLTPTQQRLSHALTMGI